MPTFRANNGKKRPMQESVDIRIGQIGLGNSSIYAAFRHVEFEGFSA